MSMMRAAAGSHADVLGLGCCKETMLMSVVRVATRDHADVCAASGCHGQESFLCSAINDRKLITENERHLKGSVTTSPPTSGRGAWGGGGNGPDRKLIESFKAMIKMPKCNPSQLMVSGEAGAGAGAEAGKDSVIFKGLITGSLTMLG